jgi:hypothetical protein
MEGRRSEAWQGEPHAAPLWEPSLRPHSGPHSGQPAPPEGTVMGHETELKCLTKTNMSTSRSKLLLLVLTLTVIAFFCAVKVILEKFNLLET